MVIQVQKRHLFQQRIAVINEKMCLWMGHFFYIAVLHELSYILSLSHAHTQVKCSLTSRSLWTGYRPKLINLGSYFHYELQSAPSLMKWQDHLISPLHPGLALNLCGTILPVMEFSHSSTVHFVPPGARPIVFSWEQYQWGPACRFYWTGLACHRQ